MNQLVAISEWQNLSHSCVVAAFSLYIIDRRERREKDTRVIRL